MKKRSNRISVSFNDEEMKKLAALVDHYGADHGSHLIRALILEEYDTVMAEIKTQFVSAVGITPDECLRIARGQEK